MKKYKTARSLYNNIYKKYHDNREKASNDITELPTVLEFLGNIKGKKLLDVGCGLGKHSAEFIKRGAIVTGFDASEKMVDIAKAKNKNNGEFFRDDYEKVSFKANSFDCINASFSLNYAKHPEKIIKKVATWLRKDGIFTFSIPHPVWLLSRVKEMDYSKPHKIWIKMDSYDVEVFNYYHPLDEFIQIFKDNNLALLNITETTVSKRLKDWPEYKYRLPNAFVFKLKKS